MLLLLLYDVKRKKIYITVVALVLVPLRDPIPCTRRRRQLTKIVGNKKLSDRGKLIDVKSSLKMFFHHQKRKNFVFSFDDDFHS